MSAYTIYKELFPPQTVEHVKCGQFIAPDATNLIVAKASLLQIYDFVEYIPNHRHQEDEEYYSGTTVENDRQDNEEQEQALVYPKLKPLDQEAASSGRLELVAQYKLNGNVASMDIVRTSSPRGKQGCDSLLLAFSDAKMSLLEWSPATNSIVTVSIHYYEREEFKKEFLTNPYPPDIHIDPQQRCAVLNFYGDKLAVLPFRQPSDSTRAMDLEATDNHSQKWPYLPSFVIDLESIDKRIKNVIDMTFLGGYYEPTLAILFQTNLTWTGRLANAKDTVSVVVISLDITSKVYPIIYSLDNLPYDCRKLVAMPKPVDGLLIIASNSLLHVSQGSPGVGVAVNGYTKRATDFPGMIYDDKTVALGLALDGAKALVLTGRRLLLFLQNGDWVCVDMRLDGSKVVGMDVKSIRWSQVNSLQKQQQVPLALIPSCVTSVKDGEYFFLGSRVGDSLLVKWSKRQSAENPDHPDTGDLNFRVCDRLINTGPILDMAVGHAEHEEEIAVEGQKLPDLELISCSGYGQNGSLCIFQRHVRPISTFSFNQPDSKAVWSVKCRKEHFFEGVQVGGNYHHQGASGAPWDTGADTGNGDVWGGSSMEETFDKLLFIGKSRSTLVLAAGEELQELQNTGFFTSGPTILVGTMFDHTRIVQVHANAVMLLTADGKLNQTISMRQSTIIDASIQDPYLLIRLSNQSMMVFKGEGDASSKQLVTLQIPSFVTNKQISMASIFADTSGTFMSISEKRREQRQKEEQRQRLAEKKRKAEDAPPPAAATKNVFSGPTESDFDEIDYDLYGEDVVMSDNKKQPPGSVNTATNTVQDMDCEDDDDALYGYQGTDKQQESASAPATTTTSSSSTKDVDHKNEDKDETMLYGDTTSTHSTNGSQVPELQEATGKIDEMNVSIKGNVEETKRVSFWCLVYTADGTLQIYSLPDFEQSFNVPEFDNLSSLLIDRPPAESMTLLPGANYDQIQEILMANIGKERKDPHLVVRTSTNDVVLYKAFSYLPDNNGDEDHHIDGDTEVFDCHREKVQENRLALRFSRVHHEYVFTSPEINPPPVEPKLSDNGSTQQRRLIPFNDVAGYTGVFVAGPQPALLVCSCKSFVRVHPVKVETNDIVGFTQFHNVNCEHGFITLDSNSNVKLCRLPTDGITYDMDWVLRKVPMGQAVHKIKYHPPMRVYSALVSQPRSVRLRNDEGVPIDGQEENERDPGAFLPTVNQYSMIMISPVTWEVVDRVDFQEYEQGLSLECVVLESKQTSTGKKHFMAVGTGYLRGEDTAMRGSIYIFDIIEVVPEPNNPQTNHRYKHLHTEDVKGAVSAMCDVSGHLVSCIGSKVIIWSFEDNESLVGVAFIDVQIYVTSISSIKNFILLGDAQKSVWFLGFQLEPAKLVLLGKDYQSFEVSSVDFIIDDKSMYLLVGDTDDNLDIFQYAPFNLQSFGGQKLMRRGDFHVGTQVGCMVRLPQIIRKGKQVVDYSRRHFCLCGTYGGSFSVVSPIAEKTFKRLNTLYGQLVNGLQHVAGLNPRAYRLMKGPKQRMSSNRTKAVLDGDLIFEFAGLSVSRQREMTKQIGTTVARIMEDLVDIDSSIDHF